MSTAPEYTDSWNKLAFRLGLSCNAVVIAYMAGICFYGLLYTDYACINGQWRLLHNWLSIGQTVELWAGVILVFWSYFFMRAPARYRHIRYGLIGICASLISFAIYGLDLAAYEVK
jgi:hypothetical protein